MDGISPLREFAISLVKKPEMGMRRGEGEREEKEGSTKNVFLFLIEDTDVFLRRVHMMPQSLCHLLIQTI